MRDELREKRITKKPPLAGRLEPESSGSLGLQRQHNEKSLVLVIGHLPRAGRLM
jgi:hypothetical protein